MSDIYNANPNQVGGYTSIVGQSSNRGYYEKTQNLPFYQGRSILATIPEYQRNPLMLEKDLLMRITEGRPNLMKIILESAEINGITVSDLRYRLPIEVEPLQRIYLDRQHVTTTKAGRSTIKIKGNNNKIATAMPGGNPKQVGDIARLEEGQFAMVMFSWVEPRRKSSVAYDGATGLTVYHPSAPKVAPVPEIVRIVSVDYNKSTITVERFWAGSHRTTTPDYTSIGDFDVVANNSSATWGVSGAKVPEKFAYIIPMSKSMKEDEIDVKVRNYTDTFTSGVLQRHALGWGSQALVEVISQNLGLQSPGMRSKRQTIKDFYDHWEWTFLFGEQSEAWDPVTGYWQGTTDGLLARIPKSHMVAIKGIDYEAGLVAGNSENLGTFHPLIFNKFLEGKAYIGSQEKVLVCGSEFYNNFTAMINFMTQNVPDIKSEWGVFGKRFHTSDGLTVDVVPSDKMSLNGLSHSAILYDKKYFRAVNLQGYPGADIIELNNENPLKSTGIIHGIKGVIDLNPDAHWMFTVVSKRLPDGSINPEYQNLDILGEPLE